MLTTRRKGWEVMTALSGVSGPAHVLSLVARDVLFLNAHSQATLGLLNLYITEFASN